MSAPDHYTAIIEEEGERFAVCHLDAAQVTELLRLVNGWIASMANPHPVLVWLIHERDDVVH